MAIKLVISGCGGKMGRTITSLALSDSSYAIGAALEAAGHEALGQDVGTVLGRAGKVGIPVTDDARRAITQGDVVIEFTIPEVTVAHVQLAVELRKPMVIGTTGLTESQRAALRDAAASIPIVFSPNMSVGVSVLFELAQLAAQRLGSPTTWRLSRGTTGRRKIHPAGRPSGWRSCSRQREKPPALSRCMPSVQGISSGTTR